MDKNFTRCILTGVFLIIVNFAHAQVYGGREIESKAIDVVGYIGGKDKNPGKDTDRSDPNVAGAERGSNGKDFLSRERKTSNDVKSTVTLNGKSYMISKHAQERLSNFINEYKTTQKVSNYVTTLASLLALFDIFKIDKNNPVKDGIDKVVNINIDEIIEALSITNEMNLELRRRAAEFAEKESYSSTFNGKHGDARMWNQLRDIIASPERYKGGGVKFDATKKNLIIKSLPAENYRSIAGFNFKLKPADIIGLAHLTDYLMYFQESRDFMIYADYLDKPL